MTHATIVTPSIYVGTYAKYNSGSIKGAWLDLSDYADRDAFYDACAELHSDEADPEYMFQDWEGIPEAMVSECSIDEAMWELMAAYGEHGQEAVEAYVSIFGEWDTDAFNDRYQGEWADDETFADNFIESIGMLADVPDSIARYFDYSAFARDLMFDYSEENGHYFSNY